MKYIRIWIPDKLLFPLGKEAEERNRKEKWLGSMTYDSSISAFDAHMICLRTELAVAMYFNVDRDKTILDWHGDDGRDFNITDYGVTQLKSTNGKYDHPWLRAEVKHDKEYIDTYMLCLHYGLNHSIVDLVGWMPRSQVINRTPSVCPGKEVERPLSYIVKTNIEPLNPIPINKARLKSIYQEYHRSVKNKPIKLQFFLDYYKKNVKNVLGGK